MHFGVESAKLNNFKSLDFDRGLKVNSLNLLCGSNSSGKSSLIQSILMISQTFSTRLSRGSISLNGHLVKLGGFEDVKSNFGSSESISFAFSIDPGAARSRGSIGKVDVEFEIGFVDDSSEELREQLNPPLISSEISVAHECDDGSLQTSKISTYKSKSDSVGENSVFEVDSYSGEYFTDVLSRFPDSEIVGCRMNGFVPDFIDVKYDHRKLLAEEIVTDLLSLGRSSLRFGRHGRTHKTVNIPAGLFKKLLEIIDRDYKERHGSVLANIANKKEKSSGDVFSGIDIEDLVSRLLADNLSVKNQIEDIFIDVGDVSRKVWHSFCNKLDLQERKSLFSVIRGNKPELIASLGREISAESRVVSIPLELFRGVYDTLESSLGSGVKYLGPLRSDPKSIYPITGLIDPDDVGVKGENAAAVFHLNRRKKVSCPLPVGSTTSVSGYNSFDMVVVAWLRYMGVVELVSTSDKGKFGYELKVKTTKGDSLQDLTHVGVGVSQVLPIVMLCALSKPGDILIFEQPELHLHPKVQARLTDFFLMISSLGRQVFVETHSEYMINRFRYRVAASDDEDVLSRSKVYFVNKHDGVSDFVDVKVTKYGAIEKWPDDFFDQTQNEVERILLAGSNKKRLERAAKRCKL